LQVGFNVALVDWFSGVITVMFGEYFPPFVENQNHFEMFVLLSFIVTLQ